MTLSGMAIVGAIVVASVNEMFAFLTLSLILQVGIASRYIAPYIAQATGANIEFC
jgi:hypothetical protein